MTDPFSKIALGADAAPAPGDAELLGPIDPFDIPAVEAAYAATLPVTPTARVWTDPTNPDAGETVTVTTGPALDLATWTPVGPVLHQGRLPDHYEDADIIAAADDSLAAAGWTVTEYWVADSFGWRASVGRIAIPTLAC
ncbi:hypothetical protein [Nocardia sp. XZ_19_231]|uniref:hypothetical protein n=1 Tax=Nocardia sp. XZ_19_231 TaxID=2769252 RepID=UPI00188FF29D|nr:hypothetical protein [Nocardia sp. XZ_19_231]